VVNPEKRDRRLASIVTKADISVVIVLTKDVTAVARIQGDVNVINGSVVLTINFD